MSNVIYVIVGHTGCFLRALKLIAGMSADSRFYLNMVKSIGQYGKWSYQVSFGSVLQQASSYTFLFFFFLAPGVERCVHTLPLRVIKWARVQMSCTCSNSVSAAAARERYTTCGEMETCYRLPPAGLPPGKHTHMHTTTNRHIQHRMLETICKCASSKVKEFYFLTKMHKKPLMIY